MRRPYHHRFFVPKELVEHSTFLDKGSGMIDPKSMTTCDQMKAWFYDGRSPYPHSFFGEIQMRTSLSLILSHVLIRHHRSDYDSIHGGLQLSSTNLCGTFFKGCCSRYFCLTFAAARLMKLINIAQLSSFLICASSDFFVFNRLSVLLGYFIASQYITSRETTFISLDRSAGVCEEVPLSVTGTYSVDSNGHWIGNSLYNPSDAYYSFEMSNFIKKVAQYESIISDQKVSFAALGAVGKLNDLATNLLYWVGWSQIVNDGNSTQRWQLTGDARVLFDRQNYLGAMGNSMADCIAPSLVTYNAATGKFLMTYSKTAFVTTGSCNNIVTPAMLSYDAAANGDTLTMKWDGTSLIIARAVNEGVSHM